MREGFLERLESGFVGVLGFVGWEGDFVGFAVAVAVAEAGEAVAVEELDLLEVARFLS